MSTQLHILQVADEYIRWCKDDQTREPVEASLKRSHIITWNLSCKQICIYSNDMVSLQSLLGKRMAFGTAGLRGPMGPGYAQMNNLVVMQTAQGLIQYILNDLGESAKQMVIKFINIYLYFSY